MPELIVTVHRFEQLWREPPTGDGEPPRAAYLIECSAGTYVRSLIADLEDAYCEQLRRTAIGPFAVAEALPPPRRGEQWDPRPLSIEAALAALPAPASRLRAPNP